MAETYVKHERKKTSSNKTHNNIAYIDTKQEKAHKYYVNHNRSSFFVDYVTPHGLHSKQIEDRKSSINNYIDRRFYTQLVCIGG